MNTKDLMVAIEAYIANNLDSIDMGVLSVLQTAIDSLEIQRLVDKLENKGKI